MVKHSICKTPVDMKSLGANSVFWELMDKTVRPGAGDGMYAGIVGTGIENSDPVVGIEERKTGHITSLRRNQLSEAGGNMYDLDMLRGRLERVKALGVTWLRVAEGYSLRHREENEFDFRFTETIAKECARLGFTRIDDRLHFGLPEWMHKKNPLLPYFLNPDWPYYFAAFNRECTKRDPVPYLTLVNEPVITALFSSMYGFWNEQRQDERSLVIAMINIARGIILGRQATEAVWAEEDFSGKPLYFQNESLELSFASNPKNKHSRNAANRREDRKRVILNLAFGHHDPKIEQYLLRYGMRQADYDWFMVNGTMERTVLGIDHYPPCIKTIHGHNSLRHHNLRDRYLLEGIIKEYWHYYNDGRRPESQMPIFHMEVNAPSENGPTIWTKTYNVMQHLLTQGYPVIGASWFGDEDQDGWQHTLCALPGKRWPVGLYSRGKPQPVCKIFAEHVIRGFRIPDEAIKERNILSQSIHASLT